MSPSTDCFSCGQRAKYSILLSKTRNVDQRPPVFRFYIPNQTARDAGAYEEVWFCPDCMRALEDGFRATLLYLQSESGML